MKVILMEDIKPLGSEGDLVTVKDGYARNYLVPRKMAIEANKANMNIYKARKKAKESKTEREKENAEKLKEKLEGVKVVLKAKAGENEKLFGAVTNGDIAGYLKEKGFDIDKKKIELEDTIKSLGTYQAVVRLYPNISTALEVIVEKE